MRKSISALFGFAVLPMMVSYAEAARDVNYKYATVRGAEEESSQYIAPKTQTTSKTTYRNTSKGRVKQTRTTTTETKSVVERKYFLAHPFFQPLAGRFGSITDFSYSRNSFDFNLLNARLFDIDKNSAGYNPDVPFVAGGANMTGKAKTSQFTIKEDVSFGLTDTLTLLGMLQFDSNHFALKNWVDHTDYNLSWPDNEDSDNGLNVYGVGLQGRIVDTNEYIGLLTGFFRHENDSVNMFSGEIKLGYKIKRTTIYGALNLSYFDFSNDVDTYGMQLVDASGDYMMLSYQTNVDNVFYAEGSLGVFSVLNKYITARGELIYGNYDWHNQLNLRAEFGYQPKDRFAVTLYGMVNLYDSADDMSRVYMQQDINPEDTDKDYYPAINSGTTAVYRTGEYKIKNYNEWRIGAQAILYF